MKFIKFIASVGMAATLFVGAAQAAQYSFFNISNNSGISGTLGSQFTVDVTDIGSGQVSFLFKNNVGVASSITDIYFDDQTGTLSSNFNLVNTGASFSAGASPGDLSGGNPYNFVTTPIGASADSDSPVSPNGINSASRSVEFKFELVGGKTFADVLAAIDDGGIGAPGSDGAGLRFGLHVQSIGTTGQSDAFINGPCAVNDDDCDGGSTFTPVPVPASLPLLAGALGVAGFVARRKKRA